MTSTNGFLERYSDDVFGTLSGFDRVRLRGTLRLIANASGMRSFLAYRGVLLKDFAQYVHAVTTEVKQGIEGVSAAAGRPLVYLARPGDDKEQVARGIAQRDGIEAGL
ncbi:MAG: hypothetical protein M3373_05600, partial [Gemmatimonadota bacterium]|nr:hypothetical protein [Gemmatimonadota bacterium]